MTQPAWNFSDLTLDTARMLLRPMHESDAARILAMRSNPKVMRYGSSGVWSKIEQAQALIARDTASMLSGDALRLALVPHGEQEIIGTCTLFRFHRPSRRAEIGYDLHPDHWHKGYMQEALHALLGYGFSTLELNRVEADIHPDNLASARTVERHGFTREGLLRERWIVEGEVSDTVLYGLIAREWHARR